MSQVDVQPSYSPPFMVLRNALSRSDLDYLKAASKAHLQKPDPIPCFVLLNDLQSTTASKIETLVKDALGETPHYLNDFYFYSDGAFGAGWHVDTELFTFDECWNAWILLSPDEITGPLAIIDDLNNAPDDHFHSLKTEDGHVIFQNYRSGKQRARTVADVEGSTIGTPRIALGDILLFNPRNFHRTSTTVPKHAMVIKYALKRGDSFLSKSQVPAMFWPEVKMFNRMLKGVEDWSDFLASVRVALQDPEQRKALSAGFFPEKIDLYRERSTTL